MKITYFINQYPKVSHTFIRREILALERLGHEIQRISLRGWDEKPIDSEDITEQQKTKYVLKAGVFALCISALKVMLMQPSGFMSAFVSAIKMGVKADKGIPYHIIYLLEACQTYLWVKQAGSAHIHAHFGTNPSEVAMLVNIIGQIPFSFTVHGPEEFDRPQFLKLTEKINQSKFVAGVSSFGRSQLQRWVAHSQWDKIKVVHCGLEKAFYDVPHIPITDSPKLVCVGRLCEQKGQLLLIEAARILHQKGINFELILAGDGEMRPEIEDMIRQYALTDKIKITGWISSHQVREHLLASQALVLPSFAEGLPVVIMEAMSLSRPVISTYIAGIPELVEQGKCGWLVPAGSAELLANAMQMLLNTPLDELNAMGEYARKRVVERHNIDNVAKKLSEYFIV